LVSVAREEFDRVLNRRPNQIDRLREEVSVGPEQLLQVPKGTITEQGLRLNVRVGIQYLEAWLGGLGCVPLYNLMEDAATAEISRTQVWQWVHNPRGILSDGRKVTMPFVRQIIEQEVALIERTRAAARTGEHLDQARRLFADLVADEELQEFLTLKAYDTLLENEKAAGRLEPANTVPLPSLAAPEPEPLQKVA
jgi:malate synthase